ncbi:hypothetical protein ACFYY8_18620 [Streptosporangium sp. NPDC001559]|uniref:hypothetical protein n=1 Tax=Streptosporangium sp. NPDC001559 TaxID=3366187 RepID=UPI0036F154C3
MRAPHEGLARPLLQVASVPDANGIPQTVLTGAPVLEYLAQRRRSDAAGEGPQALSPADAYDKATLGTARLNQEVHPIRQAGQEAGAGWGGD